MSDKRKILCKSCEKSRAARIRSYGIESDHPLPYGRAPHSSPTSRPKDSPRAAACRMESVNCFANADRVNAFIVDDSLFERTSCKKTELGSRVFDHVSMKYRKGYRLMTLGWTDGNTFLPANSSLLASSKESNLIGPAVNYDGRSLAAKRRKLAQMKGTDIMIGKEQSPEGLLIIIYHHLPRTAHQAFCPAPCRYLCIDL